MIKHDINLDKIEANVSTLFEELEKGLRSDELSAEDRAEIKADLEELEFKAYALKIDLQLNTLMKSRPDISAKDVTIQLLSHLLPESSPAMVTRVAKHILMEWEKWRLKAAA